MTHLIRLDLAIGSVGIMRRALVLAGHHARGRRAFGQPVADLPQTRNALADIALESEAATLLAMRMAAAIDRRDTDETEAALLRVGVPVAKYWICRRANPVVLEALESHGGMGYIEEQPIARLMREAPLNSIWEGTAAMMGLDFVRALRREPGARDALLGEIRLGTGDSRFDRFAERLAADLGRADADTELEPRARGLLGRTALALQASLLVRHAPAETAELFIASRLDADGGHELGTLEAGGPILARVLERALPPAA